MGTAAAGKRAETPIEAPPSGGLKQHRTLSIPANYVAAALLVVVCSLGIASVVVHLGDYAWGRAFPRTPFRLFDLDTEGNIPTWYSSSALLACSFLLAFIATVERRNRTPFAIHWGILALIFLGLSMDETARIHEWIGQHVQRALGTSGYLGFAWVIPGSIFVLLCGLAYLRFLAALDPQIRWRIVLAGTLFVSGALGMEFLGGHYHDLSGPDSAVYRTLVNIEEILEMLGIVVFLHALLLYIATQGDLFGIRVSTGPLWRPRKPAPQQNPSE